MNDQSRGSYIKHIYWLKGSEESRLRQELKFREKIHIKSAKGVVCTPLDEINKISSVAPEIWNQTCARQGSWYRASGKNGLYLVVSSFELRGFGKKKAATITRTQFKPPRRANIEEKEQLIHDKAFMTQIPAEWQQVNEMEKKIYLRWAKRLGSDVDHYDFLYLSQTANHANFIKPQLFIKEKETIIPYSIDRTAHLCSCCLELFQIIGSQFPKKLVAPCPGAALFARLKPDQFLLVERPE